MTQQTYTPDWSKAPTDANWHARDSDGCGFWYNKRPAQSRGFWAAGCSLTVADNACPVLDDDSALDNWRETLTVRPFQSRDIPQNLSDYFTGKTNFITAYVDLLLARMAKENRFSDDDNEIELFKVNDIIKIEDDEGYSFAVFDSIIPTLPDYSQFITLDRGVWGMANRGLYKNCKIYSRTITELEAVEFRKAMEAVYG